MLPASCMEPQLCGFWSAVLGRRREAVCVGLQRIWEYIAAWRPASTLLHGLCLGGCCTGAPSCIVCVCVND